MFSNMNTIRGAAGTGLKLAGIGGLCTTAFGLATGGLGYIPAVALTVLDAGAIYAGNKIQKGPRVK